MAFKKMTQKALDAVLKEYLGRGELVFKNYDLKGLDLSGREMENVRFVNTNLSGANLKGIRLRNSDFKDCILIGANLEGANLFQVNFSGCAMQRTNLSHVQIEGVGFKNTNMVNVNLRSTEMEFSQLNLFMDVNLNGANLSGAKLNWIYGEKVTFIQAVMKDSSITESSLKDCDFTDASMDDISLFSVKFVDCLMERTALPKSQIANTCFETSRLKEVVFNGAEVEYVSFMDVKLEGTQFKGTNFHGTNQFQGGSLAESDFSGARFYEQVIVEGVDTEKVEGFSAAQRSVLVRGALANGYAPVVREKGYRELSPNKEYQYHLDRFRAQFPGAEVDSGVDSKIVWTMIEQRYSLRTIRVAVAMLSPNAPKDGDDAKTYAEMIIGSVSV